MFNYAPPFMRRWLWMLFVAWAVYTVAVIGSDLILKASVRQSRTELAERQRLVWETGGRKGPTPAGAPAAPTRYAVFTTQLFWTYSACFVVAWPLYRWRIRKDVRATDRKTCGQCQFNLSAHSGHCTCPECGTEYELGALQRYWTWYILDTHGWRVRATNFLLRSGWTPRFVAVLLAALWIGGWLLVPSHWTGLLIAALPPLLFAASRISNQMLARRLLRTDRCVCRRCAADLPREPGSGMCPACGREYALEDERQYWLEHAPAHWDSMFLTRRSERIDST
jgi:hypothetical protein